MTAPEEFDAQRRQILRRISMITWGLGLAAVALAVAGGALLAWFFQGAGFPFRPTWLVATLLLLAIPVIVNVAARLKGRTNGG